MSEYYRMILDFSHEETDWEEFEKFFDRITEAIVSIIDPDHEDDEPCARYWAITGQSVTKEYQDAAQKVEDVVAAEFRDVLDATESAEEFLQFLTHKDEDEDDDPV